MSLVVATSCQAMRYHNVACFPRYDPVIHAMTQAEGDKNLPGDLKRVQCDVGCRVGLPGSCAALLHSGRTSGIDSQGAGLEVNPPLFRAGLNEWDERSGLWDSAGGRGSFLIVACESKHQSCPLPGDWVAVFSSLVGAHVGRIQIQSPCFT